MHTTIRYVLLACWTVVGLWAAGMFVSGWLSAREGFPNGSGTLGATVLIAALIGYIGTAALHELRKHRAELESQTDLLRELVDRQVTSVAPATPALGGQPHRRVVALNADA